MGFLDDKEGIDSLSVVYYSKIKLDMGVEKVSVCYEVTVNGEYELKYYGLASLVREKWFVTIPSLDPLTAKCPQKLAS